MQVLLALALAASAGDPELPNPQGLTLVLSSGGARALAQLGVIEELEAARIPIGRVVGSELGALIGGLYASGLEAREIHAWLTSRNWFDALADRELRRALSMRAKQEDRSFLFDVPISVNMQGLVLPGGVRDGRRLRLELARFTLHSAATSDFDELPLPFRAVASDLASGTARCLGEGSLPLAIEASLATPVIYPAVPYGAELLVSGAWSAPVPIRAALEFSSAPVLVVDVAQGPDLKARPNLLDVAEHTLELSIRARAAAELAQLRPTDWLCQPQMQGLDASEYTHAEEAMQRGRESLRALLPQLSSLALSETEFAAWRAAQRARRAPLPRLAAIEVDERGSLSAESIRARIDSPIGERLQPALLASDLARLYGLRQFVRVGFELEPDASGTEAVLRVRTEDVATSPWHWRVGMSGELAAGERVNFVVGAAVRYSPSDEWGSEWRVNAEAGNRFLFGIERRQALDPSGTWFLAPALGWSRRPVRVELGAGDSAEFSVEEFDVALNLIAQINESWEAGLGLRWASGRAAVDIGQAALGDISEEAAGISAGLLADSLDDTAFPTDGSMLRAVGFVSFDELSSDDDDTIQVSVDRVYTLWGGSCVLGAELATVVESGASVQNFFPLGGFLRLSGLGSDTISGPTSALARAVYFHPLGAQHAQRSYFTWYAGASIEAGNVFPDLDAFEAGELLLSNSLFLGLDTFVGPFYAGVGLTEGGNSSYFIVLGRIF